MLGEWLEARGYEVQVVALYDGRRPPSPDGYDLVVVLGSEHAAYDETVPWHGDVRDALRAARDADVPSLGVCFGGQALALALGGEARPAARPELGWVSIGADDVGQALPDGPWFTWHGDEMVPPPGAEVLARNASGVQCWRLGRAVALQFHPEVSAAIVDGWLGSAPDKVRARGVDPDELSAQTHELAAEARDRAFALFDALLART